MPLLELHEQDVLDEIAALPEYAPAVQDERAARQALRGQIARLEHQLGAAFVDAFPRAGLRWSVAGPGGPRLLDLGELEAIRDGLAERLRDVRGELARRAEREAEARLLLEEMYLAPGRHRWARVRNADLGEPGCTSYAVRPKLGPVGLLMGWWRVKVSSGCPLATG